MSENLISIIMPIKNGSNYMQEALEGIKSQNIDMQIIVVDDGSNDKTAQIAQNFGCTVLKHKISKGPAFAKNTALKIAQGKYIMFHDHDDIMSENILPKMLQELKQNEEIFAVMAKMQDFFSPELSTEERKKIAIRPESYFGLFSGSILMKKEIFDIIGLFNGDIKAGDAIDWGLKMSKNNLQIKRLDFISANRRIHNSNYGRKNQEAEFKDYASILRSKLKKN